MSTQTTGTFDVESWDEKPFTEVEGGPKLAHASVTFTYHGGIGGTGTSGGELYYSGQGEGWGSGTSHAYEQIVGSIDGRAGSVVVEHVAAFAGDTVEETWTIVAGSGTGELAGISGTGSTRLKHGEPMNYTLDYSFA